jgi:hypothetical protein
MLTAWGFAPDAMPVISAVRAALRRDAAALARLRELPAPHLDPSSTVWKRLGV